MTEARDFWSRRKARVAEEAEAEEAAVEARALAEAQAGKSDEELLQELGLPDPDTLCQGDDFSAFMARVVPDRIRSRALRRLWLTNPVLANVDGLVDYGEDFTDAACVIENLTTTYQVGKGMTAHVEEMARQADLPEPDAPEAVAEAEMETEGQAEVQAGAEMAEDVAGTEAPLPADTAPEAAALHPPEPAFAAAADADAPAPRRRMRFSFDDINQTEVRQA